MSTTNTQGITRTVRINVGGDDKATPKVKHPINWEYSFPCNTPQEADAFLSARAYAYAARASLHEDAINRVITKDTTPYTLQELRELAIETVTTPNEARGGGNGGGNPALASKAQAFAGLVASGALTRETVLPLLATGKATMADAITALDKAIAKLA